MLYFLLNFALPTLVACGSQTSIQQDTSSLISDEDTSFFEPSSDTQEPIVDTQDSEDTSPPHGPPFSISSISPQYGPTIGETQIYIYGSDMENECFEKSWSNSKLMT